MTKQRGAIRPERLKYLMRSCRLVFPVAAIVLGTGSNRVSDRGVAHAQKPSTRVQIAVIKSLDLPPYNSAYRGFVKTLTATGYEPIPTELTLTSDTTNLSSSLREICASRPDLILALGTRAAREVATLEKEIPIIYSMVLDSPARPGHDTELPTQPNLTGASLNIPLQVQLEHIHTLFPSARHIGIISDPSRTRSIVESAKIIAPDYDVALHVEWVEDEGDVPDAVRALTESIDVLWMLPDETVITPRSSRFIIFELIKAGVPIMGLSSAYVKAGAVIALDCDYEDIGRQSGELAVRVLAGQSPASLAETAPRVFTLAVNDKVRDHLRVEMDEQVIKSMNVINY